MQNTHWSLKKYEKKIKSCEIIKRKSIDVPESKKIKVIEKETILKSPKEIKTPKKQIHVVTPSKLIVVKGSPRSKRYRSARKIDF